MNTLAIDRLTWLRGTKEGAVLKSEQDGRQCCLGFETKACGFTDADILGRALPSSIPPDQYKRPGIDQDRWAKLAMATGLEEYVEATTVDSDFSMQAAKINDDAAIPEEVREQKLIELFAGQDIALSFVN